MRYCVLLFILLSCACTQTVKTCPDLEQAHTAVQCPRQWNVERAKYHIRQAGIIPFADKEFPIEGYMILEPGKFKASLTVWSILGMKMFALRIFKKQIKCDYLQPGLKRIPNFASLAGKCVQRCFFKTVSGKNVCVRKGQEILACRQTKNGPVHYIYNLKGLLKKKVLDADRHKWSVSYRDYFRQGQKMYPSTVVYYQKEFELSLKIKAVDKL